MLVGELVWGYAQRVGTKKGFKKGECPYLQPNSHMKELRMLFGIMNTKDGWNYSMSEDFSLTGGLKASMRDLFLSREKEWPGVRSIVGVFF